MQKNRNEKTTSLRPAHLDDREAEALVRAHIGWMIAVAQRLLGDRALAEDAVQDAFIAAFRNFENFENRSSIKTWLHRITVNAALMKLRKIKRRSEQILEPGQSGFDHNGLRIEAPWTRMASVEEALDLEQRREGVRNAIGRLPDNYRIVLLLRDIEGYRTGEVATLLDITPGTVKIRLHRARAALKQQIEPLLRGEESS